MLKAKKRPIESLTPADLGIDLASLSTYEVVEVAAPSVRQAGVMVKSAEELVRRLREEAKVLL
jgi:electron transfer flavoprotein beta subunit